MYSRKPSPVKRLSRGTGAHTKPGKQLTSRTRQRFASPRALPADVLNMPADRGGMPRSRRVPGRCPIKAGIFVNLPTRSWQNSAGALPSSTVGFSFRSAQDHATIYRHTRPRFFWPAGAVSVWSEKRPEPVTGMGPGAPTDRSLCAEESRDLRRAAKQGASCRTDLAPEATAAVRMENALCFPP